ncbi:hypothetical protein PUNSTDRAFT_139199, partial [Punctularia strigosozonata HHB-11173 SS5]
ANAVALGVASTLASPPSPDAEREPPTRSRSASPFTLVPSTRPTPSASRQRGRVRRRLPPSHPPSPNAEREPPTRSHSGSPPSITPPPPSVSR